MVKVGEVFWVASVKGVGEATNQAEELDDSMGGVAATAMSTAEAQDEAASATRDAEKGSQFLTNAMGFLGRTAFTVTDAFGVANIAIAAYTGITRGAAAVTELYALAQIKVDRWTERLKGGTERLASTIFFLSRNLSMATARSYLYAGGATAAAFASGAATIAATGLSAALYGVAGAATAAWAAIAGPAGLAIGLFLAVAAVGLLGSELLGLTDVTPVAEAETDTITGAFADMAFLIGGPLVGFLSAGFSLLTGDFDAAKKKFINTSVEWTKAAARFATRVILGFQAFGIAVKTGIAAAVEAADFAWRAGWNGIMSFTQGILNDLSKMIVGVLNDAIQASIGPLNDLIRKANKIPKINISTIGFGGIEAPQLGPGFGQVQNESLQSRLQRVSRRGNRQLRQASATARERLDRFRPDTIGGDRFTRGAGHMGDGTNIREQSVTVNVDGANLNVEDMNRSERRELAEMIGNEVGSSVGNQAGGG